MNRLSLEVKFSMLLDARKCYIIELYVILNVANLLLFCYVMSAPMIFFLIDSQDHVINM